MLGPSSTEVVHVAASIIESQSLVPRSPAELDEQGVVNLCLAAAVAKAGFIIAGHEAEACKLQYDLAASRSKALLRQAYQRLGWDVGDCDDRLKLNDAAEAHSRKAIALEYLRAQLA